jgi:hypothetical protein
MTFEYTTAEELFSLIRSINAKYYDQASANIIYLEELTNVNQVVYITQLRDAYSHLVSIFKYENILDKDAKAHIQNHLNRYSGHVERQLCRHFLETAQLSL